METPLTYAESIVIARSPADLYDMVSDVTRMGEWSPVCKACWWDEEAGPVAGAWFTGRNKSPGRDPWERCSPEASRVTERYGADAAAQVASRFEAARTGIPATLAALKRAAEA